MPNRLKIALAVSLLSAFVLFSVLSVYYPADRPSNPLRVKDLIRRDSKGTNLRWVAVEEGQLAVTVRKHFRFPRLSINRLLLIGSAQEISFKQDHRLTEESLAAMLQQNSAIVISEGSVSEVGNVGLLSLPAAGLSGAEHYYLLGIMEYKGELALTDAFELPEVTLK